MAPRVKGRKIIFIFLHIQINKKENYFLQTTKQRKANPSAKVVDKPFAKMVDNPCN